jgi:lactate dehydrogenase-like 2-hydroxyacid dehydrogenase
MIGAWRGIVAGHEHIVSGRWETGGERLRPFGSLTGKTVGILGLGHIGLGVAERAQALKMKVAWWGPRAKDVPWTRYEKVLDLAAASDVLIVACRADDTTRNLVDGPVMEALGKRGLLVNVARGQVIDEDAMIAALIDRRLGMAALDVFWKEPTPAARWRDIPNIVLTPHSAGAAAETVLRMVGQTVENMRRHFAGEPLLSPVPAD